jgi:hypothetical protein
MSKTDQKKVEAYGLSGFNEHRSVFEKSLFIQKIILIL